MGEQSSGTVKWYSPEKAYGFLTRDDGQDIFVHRKAIADGRPWLIDGQGVTFGVQPGTKGPEAVEVRVVREVEEPPAPPPAPPRPAPPAARRPTGFGGGGYGERGGYGGPRPAPPRERYDGPLPDGPVLARVLRVDPSGRFLFARAEEIGGDVYVHSSLFADLPLRQGDEIAITIERSDRGLRAGQLLR